MRAHHRLSSNVSFAAAAASPDIERSIKAVNAGNGFPTITQMISTTFLKINYAFLGNLSLIDN